MNPIFILCSTFFACCFRWQTYLCPNCWLEENSKSSCLISAFHWLSCTGDVTAIGCYGNTSSARPSCGIIQRDRGGGRKGRLEISVNVINGKLIIQLSQV